MRNRIHKFPLKFMWQQYVDLPVGYKILTIQMQEGVPTLWAEVNTKAGPCNPATIEMVGTGEEPPVGPYIATVQEGKYVWHFYDSTTGLQ